jgi:hypothetical protein
MIGWQIVLGLALYSFEVGWEGKLNFRSCHCRLRRPTAKPACMVADGQLWSPSGRGCAPTIADATLQRSPQSLLNGRLAFS